MKKPGDGYREAKSKVLAALAVGSYLHEARNDIDIKNKLATGEISAPDVAALIKGSTGNDHSRSPHHSDPSIMVHVILRKGWYIKFYFVDPDTWFISVHQ
jgi:hypothetical protein